MLGIFQMSFFSQVIIFKKKKRVQLDKIFCPTFKM